MNPNTTKSNSRADSLPARTRQPKQEAQPESKPRPPETHSLQLQFLKDVQKYPDSGIAARYKRLGLSVRQGQKIKAYLAADSLIQEEESRISTGKVLRIRLTEKARDVLLRRE